MKKRHFTESTSFHDNNTHQTRDRGGLWKPDERDLQKPTADIIFEGEGLCFLLRFLWLSISHQAFSAWRSLATTGLFSFLIILSLEEWPSGRITSYDCSFSVLQTHPIPFSCQWSAPFYSDHHHGLSVCFTLLWQRDVLTVFLFLSFVRKQKIFQM